MFERKVLSTKRGRRYKGQTERQGDHGVCNFRKVRTIRERVGEKEVED